MPADPHHNVRQFILFRIFFNCRFYYPIYAILFLDLGLSVSQFAVLNVAWAVAIVLLEVPSGALADQFGRKRLVVAAAILMVMEMAVLCLVPAGGGAMTFLLFLANRMLSGAAEAAASGADEALAYDSLPEAARESEWPRWNARLMLWQSAGFIVATIVGALSYKPDAANWLLARAGSDLQLTADQTLRFPLYLSFAGALATLWTALRFREIEAEESPTVRESLRNILDAGKWIARTPAPLFLILTGVLYDAFLRLYYTVSANYYRLLGLPEQLYGFIGAAGSLVGIGASLVVARMMGWFGASGHLRGVALLAFAGLLGIAFAPRGWPGVLCAVPIWVAMRFLHYFLSHYLNLVTDSKRRATVLSFRGLAMNLGYGGITAAFGIQSAALAKRMPEAGEIGVFAAALKAWPWVFAGGVLALIAITHWRCRCSLTRAVEAAKVK